MTWMIMWLVLLIVFILIEIATMGLTTIWFAGGTLFAIVLAALDFSVPVQIGVFLIVSIILLYFTRPIAIRYFNKDRSKTNVDSLVGKQAVVVEEVDNLRNEGKATVNGMEWSVKSAEDSIRIIAGTVVEIVNIEGVKLIVEEKAEG